MWVRSYGDRKDIAMNLVFNLVTQQDAANNIEIAKENEEGQFVDEWYRFADDDIFAWDIYLRKYLLSRGLAVSSLTVCLQRPYEELDSFPLSPNKDRSMWRTCGDFGLHLRFRLPQPYFFCGVCFAGVKKSNYG